MQFAGNLRAGTIFGDNKMKAKECRLGGEGSRRPTKFFSLSLSKGDISQLCFEIQS
jgi:hypothetical protein